MKKLFFIFIIVCFNLCLLEGVLRLYLIVRYETPLVVMRKFGYDRHPLLGFEVMPNVKEQYFSSISTKFSSNSKGLRGEGEMTPKQNNEIRIGLMGGSSAFGFGASDDEHTLSFLLEKELNQLAPSKKWNVINAANPAYISYQVYARLQYRMIELDPDAMLFYMGWNDMYLCHPYKFDRNQIVKQTVMYDLDSWQNFITIFNENNLAVAGTHPFAITLFMKRAYLKIFPEKTVFDQVVNSKPENSIKSKKSDGLNEFGVPSNYVIKEDDFHAVTEMFKDNLTSIVGVCKAHEMKVFFSNLVSDVDLFGNDREKLNQSILEICQKFNVNHFDSDKYILENKFKGINNAVDKYHLTDYGNEVLAKFWAPKIVEAFKSQL